MATGKSGFGFTLRGKSREELVSEVREDVPHTRKDEWCEMAHRRGQIWPGRRGGPKRRKIARFIAHIPWLGVLRSVEQKGCGVELLVCSVRDGVARGSGAASSSGRRPWRLGGGENGRRWERGGAPTGWKKGRQSHPDQAATRPGV